MQKYFTKIFLKTTRQKLSSVGQKKHFDPYRYPGGGFAIRYFNCVSLDSRRKLSDKSLKFSVPDLPTPLKT